MKPLASIVMVSLIVALPFTGPATADVIGGGGVNPAKCTPPTAPFFACSAGATCKAGQWVPGPPLPAGTSCVVSPATGASRGTCDGKRDCIPLAPGTSGNFSPRYIVLALTYDPPGNMSQAIYTAGTGVGTVNNVSSAFGSGFTVQAVVMNGPIVGGGWSITDQYGDQYSYTMTTSEGLGMMSQADGVDHTQDMFWLWLNPRVHYEQPYKDVPNVNLNLITEGGFVPQSITVRQLLGLDIDVAGVMNGWTAADKANLLGQDPFLTPGYQIDPKRFVFNREIQLEGPTKQVNGTIGFTPVAIGYMGQDCKSNQVQVTNSVSIGADGGFTIGATGVEIQFIETFTSTETSSTSRCNQLQQTLQLTPISTTPLYCHLIDVYVDTIFETLAYLDTGVCPTPGTDSATLSGTVRGPGNRALPHQQVDLTLSNGRLRTVLSDETGRFKVVVPEGAVTIKTSDAAENVVAKGGAVITKTLHVAGPAAFDK